MLKHKLIYKLIFIVLLLIVNIYLIYNIMLLKNIENFIRYLIIIVLVLVYVLLIIIINKIQRQRNYIFIVIICILYSIFSIMIGYNIHKLYNQINKISVKYNFRSMSLVSLKDTQEIVDHKFGVLSNDLDYFMSIKNNFYLNGEIIEKKSYIDLINALYNKEITYILLPSNYVQLFGNLENYENLASDTEVLYTGRKKIKMESENNTNIDKPFSILIMGVDSTDNDIVNSSFNGDALMILTFNPDNLKTTILSIPRDTYIPISCFDGERKNKIAHAAWYGESCMIDTINSLFNINVDYYLKINFKGFVELIDLLGGIEVDVPMDFCEQDSNRNFDNMICLQTGLQTLNGEQALALSRHRKTINDFIRGDNQQLVVKAILEKGKIVSNLNLIYDVLNTISNNMITNMTTEEILSLYNIVKRVKNNNIINGFNKLSIDGYSEYIYDYDVKNNQGMKLSLYEFIPYEESIQEVANIMQENLGIDKLSTDYKEPIDLLPNFIGKNESEVKNYMEKYGIPIYIDYVSSNNSLDFEGKVISQSLPDGMDIDYIGDNGIKITVIDKVIKENINCSKVENRDNKQCILPSFIGKSYVEFNKWVKEHNYSYIVDLKVVEKDKDNYNEDKKGLIITQNYINKSIYDLIGKKIIVSYFEE